ncbi:hypothetical protein Q1695_015676 [Nippostrongylus brasiliensis]|nr:hypothetical protein Q1695_015676 [Nippostrongylus brasiliensis]
MDSTRFVSAHPKASSISKQPFSFVVLVAIVSSVHSTTMFYDRSSSSSGCSSSATCELYDLATAHALLARQQQLIQQANFPLISTAEFVKQLAHHQHLQQLQHHIQGIVHHNLVGDMALVSHPATAAAVGATPTYAGIVVKQQDKKPQSTAHQMLMQQQQLPQDVQKDSRWLTERPFHQSRRQRRRGPGSTVNITIDSRCLLMSSLLAAFLEFSGASGRKW